MFQGEFRGTFMNSTKRNVVRVFLPPMTDIRRMRNERAETNVKVVVSAEMGYILWGSNQVAEKWLCDENHILGSDGMKIKCTEYSTLQSSREKKV